MQNVAFDLLEAGLARLPIRTMPRKTEVVAVPRLNRVWGSLQTRRSSN